MIRIRDAVPADAAAMCAVINPLIEAGGTTAHRDPFDTERMISHYLSPPGKISCVVAVADGRIAGFQSVQRVDPSWTGFENCPPGWGAIASFVETGANGRGIGKRMFAATREAAVKAGLEAIDATIRRENTGGIAYYASIGFIEYRSDSERISKRYDVSR